MPDAPVLDACVIFQRLIFPLHRGSMPLGSSTSQALTFSPTSSLLDPSGRLYSQRLFVADNVLHYNKPPTLCSLMALHFRPRRKQRRLKVAMAIQTTELSE